MVAGRAGVRVPENRQGLMWFESSDRGKEGSNQDFLSFCPGHKGKWKG